MEDKTLFKDLINNSLSIEVVTDSNYHYIYANDTFNRILGFTSEQTASEPLDILMFPESERHIVEHMKNAALKEGFSNVVILPVISTDGEHIDIYLRCASIRNGEYFVWSGTDIRELTQTEHELESSLKKACKSVSDLRSEEYKLNFALDCAQSVKFEMYDNFKKIKFGETFEEILGIDQSSYNYIFEDFVTIHLNPYKEIIMQRMENYLNGKSLMVEVEISMNDIHGNLHWFIVRCKFLNDKKDCMYGVSVNITEQKLFEQRLSDMAYKDTLTGLYKMNYIMDAAAGHIESLKLSRIGLIALDINQFSNVNTVFGHKRGDDVLIHTANRLKEIAGDHLAIRIGSDDFMIVCNHMTDIYELEKLAEKIRHEFEKPLIIGSQLFYINFKMGIAFSSTDKSDFELIFKDVGIALRHAKNHDFKEICIIDDRIKQDQENLSNMRYELRRAIEQKEFVLHFQPIVSAETKKLVGSEALIRWNHPQRGIVGPFDFIPIAEETGLINPIGDFVLEESMKYLKKWLLIDRNIFTSINISVIQFMSLNIVERIKELMNKYEIPPSNIVIEITESLFISDVSHVIEILDALRSIGIKVSLDDFGTGYSSLSYLKKIPLDNLKIDRSFLLDVLQESKSEAILSSIIGLAQNLDLSVTAEGVETEEQLSLLEKYHCDSIQGFYFSKPVPPEKIEAFLMDAMK